MIPGYVAILLFLGIIGLPFLFVALTPCRHWHHSWVTSYTRYYMPGFPDEGSVQYHCSNCGRRIL